MVRRNMERLDKEDPLEYYILGFASGNGSTVSNSRKSIMGEVIKFPNAKERGDKSIDKKKLQTLMNY